MKDNLSPSFSDVRKEKQRTAANKIIDIIEDGNFGEFKYIAENLINEYDSVTALSAALKIISGTTKEYIPIELTENQYFLKIRELQEKKNYNEHKGSHKAKRRPSIFWQIKFRSFQQKIVSLNFGGNHALS